jgi:hypothetical protein
MCMKRLSSRCVAPLADWKDPAHHAGSGGAGGAKDPAAHLVNKVEHEAKLLAWGMGAAGPALLCAICQALAAMLQGLAAEQVPGPAWTAMSICLTWVDSQ